MATGGRAGRGTRPRARSESVVVPFPRRAARSRPALARLVPSGRILIWLALGVAVAIGGLMVARETSLFATRTVAVEGASPTVARQVERLLAPALGTSLTALDLGAFERAIEEIPAVAAVGLDRAYPNTLRAVVTPEHPVAVVRQGSSALLVSARGRVIGTLGSRVRLDLPRLWVTAGDDRLVPGDLVAGAIEAAIRAVSPHDGVRFRGRVVVVRSSDRELTLRLRSGLEVKLGNAEDLLLKLAVADRILPLVRPGSSYLDVSVVERPVAGMGYVPLTASVPVG